ncbi:MAG: ATP-binding protein [Legionella sp.]|uniref:sensor histidine kinase n=1 Tax=Legionella sp. TaxID=459 RepID=UPI00284E1B73|nr:ATP-binding protein [Legionella sp.]
MSVFKQLQIKIFGLTSQSLNSLVYTFTFALIFWSGLFFLKISSAIPAVKISNIAAQSEFLIHFFTLLTIFPLYANTTLEDRKILKWFLIANICLFLNDLAFYMAVYFSNHFILSTSFPVVALGYIPYLIWIGTIIIFLINLLAHNIFGIAKLSKSLPFLICLSLITIFLFFSSINHVFSYFSWERISHAISFISEFIIFNAALLCFIYSENNGFSLCLFGLITVISGDFFINYSFLSQTTSLLSYGELLWFLGLIFILFGSRLLYQNKQYIVRDWFSRTNSIKNRMALWSVSTSMSSFLLFFLMAYLFSAIDKQLLLGLPIFILVYSIIVVILSVVMGKRFETPFKQIVTNIEHLMLQNDKSKVDDNFSTQEFVFLQQFIFNAFEIKEQKEQAKQEFINITTQAAHDIRSPLAAINTVLSSMSSISEDKRLMIRNAAKRINDIANNLLLKPNQVNDNKTELNAELFDELIGVALEAIVSEKRYEHTKKKTPIYLHGIEQAYHAFVYINLASFKRVLSNLINNSIEALQHNGCINIWLNCYEQTIEIKIQDNGCGIPPDILPKVTEHGFSYNKKQGAGFGLSYAKQYIEKIQGTFQIVSEVNKGTSISICLPRRDSPNWFCDTLIINSTHISIVDDDPSIHDAWRGRLAHIPNLDIIHYERISELKTSTKNIQIGNPLYLMDYEFLTEDKNGLDVIEELNIHQHSVLVTSTFEDQELRIRCSTLGIKIIPKPYVPYIPITNTAFSLDLNNSVVLIDDDEMMRMTWQFAAEDAGLNLKTYSSFQSFISEIDNYDKNTAIYIDSDLGNDVKGEECAYHLFHQGFINLHLATGYCIENQSVFPWIKTIIGKTPPFCTSNQTKDDLEKDNFHAG